MPHYDENDQKFVVHQFGETYEQYPEAQDPDEYFHESTFGHLMIKLIKFENGYLKQVMDLPIDAQQNALIEFSHDGRYLALY